MLYRWIIVRLKEIYSANRAGWFFLYIVWVIVNIIGNGAVITFKEGDNADWFILYFRDYYGWVLSFITIVIPLLIIVFRYLYKRAKDEYLDYSYFKETGGKRKHDVKPVEEVKVKHTYVYKYFSGNRSDDTPEFISRNEYNGDDIIIVRDVVYSRLKDKDTEWS